MTDIYCNSANQKEKNVSIGGAAEPYSFTMFPRTFAEVSARDNTQITFSPLYENFVPVTFVADAGHTIWDPYTNTAVSSLSLVLQGQSVEFVFFLGANQWVVNKLPVISYAEVWAATTQVPITGTPGTPQDILWTQVPIFLGQTSTIFNYAAGVFTYALARDRNITVELSIKTTINLTGQNQDVNWAYRDVFSGAGNDWFADIVLPFAHSKVGNYEWNQQSSGGMGFTLNDTLKFTSGAVATALATVDLTSGFLIFGLDD